MDHNAVILRAVAGGYEPSPAKPLTIPPSAWVDLGAMQEHALDIEKPPTQEVRSTRVTSGLTGGVRYRWSLKCKEENYRVYEATAWEVSLELLDAQGNVVAAPTTPYGHPHPLKLGAPLSDQPTHGWTETAQYFDAPPSAVACRASFRAVGGAHYFTLGKLWLGPIELRPVGRPHRQIEQQFITLVIPLDKGAPPPKIETGTNGVTRIIHSEIAADEIALSDDGALTLTEREGAKVLAAFSDRAAGGAAPTAGLKTNSEESAAKLSASLKPILDDIAAERDVLTTLGRRNLALTAKVSASAFRDERFAPGKVADNLTAEYPLAGHLDYMQGIELYDRRRTLLAGRDGTFGKVFNRSFKAAFAVPKWFDHYTPTFAGMLERELTVPFGDSWQEISFPRVQDVAFVRVIITKYWGIGGGLNEIQLYGE